MRSQIANLLIQAAANPMPAVPEAGRLIWIWFVEISNARHYGMNGPQPIAHTEIEAWARLMNIPLRPDHVSLLRRMDDAWLAKHYESLRTNDPPDGVKTLPPASKQAITPALFDAVT